MTIDGTVVVFVRRVEQMLVSAYPLIPPDVDRRHFSRAARLFQDVAKSRGSADTYPDRQLGFSVEMGQDQASVHQSLIIGARFYCRPASSAAAGLPALRRPRVAPLTALSLELPTALKQAEQ